MKHLGDITKINGAEIEPVDVITGGSPCQDLSIAGKRKGLAGERSGLFMEQLRVIKEMRDATSGTDNIRPRYMVWENVPGAFSSNKGEDFRAVLEETARVIDKDTVVPRPPKDKWTNAGAIMGNGWSIAWRVLDAQFWGVPQRRRRIALVADFGGESAPEILLKPESVSGHFAEGGTQGERTAGDVEGGFGAAGFDGYNAQLTGDVSSTLGVNCGMSTGRNGVVESGVRAAGEPVTYSGENVTSPFNKQTPVPGICHTLDQDSRNYLVKPNAVAYSFDSLSSNSMKSSNPHGGCREVEIAKCLDTTDPNPSKNQGGVAVVQPQTLKIRSGCEGGGKGALIQDNLSATLGCNNDQTLFVPTYCLQGNGIDRADTAGCNGKGWTEDVCYTLNTIDRPAVMGFSYKASAHAGSIGCADELAPSVLAGRQDVAMATYQYQSFGEYKNSDIASTCKSRDNKDATDLISNHMTVRRLTPLECSRLQGYPDNWAHIPGWKNPTKEEVEWWTEVHYNWGVITSDKPEKVKRKTEKYIRKWLKNPCSDSAEYKAYGNSIALPQWRYVLGNICDQLGRKATLGSLFDGIGGFCLVWSEINGAENCRWSSEIEPYCIAVSKYHFGG